MTLNQKLQEIADKYDDKTALIYEDNDISYSYKNLIEAIDALCFIFIRNGLKPKDKTAIYMNNSINWIASFYAILKIGAVPVLIDSQYTARELKECLDASGTCIIILDDNKNKIENALSNDIKKAFIFSADGSNVPGNKFIPINSDLKTYNFEEKGINNIDDGEMILFTYRGLGYVLPVLLKESSVLNSVIYNTILTEIDPELVIGLFLPSHHIFALTSNILCPLSVAGMIIITNNYMPANLIRIIEKYRINFILAVPTIIKILLHSYRKKNYDLSFIRKGVIGGDTFDLSLSDEWFAITGRRLMQGYGLTETCPVICNGLIHNKPRSIGRLLGKSETRIIDKYGKAADINEPGRLWIKSDTMMDGYYNKENLNKEFIKDGFFDTGDIVYKDVDDFYYFVRRDKKIAKIGGSTVDINEILEVIRNHPDVKQADLNIEEDALWQEKLVLKVSSSIELNKIDILIYLKNRLSPSKIPKDIIFC